MKISLPLHSVISFSVINYVVMMRHPRESDEVSFCFIQVCFLLREEVGAVGDDAVKLTLRDGTGVVQGPDTGTVAHVMEP